MTWLQIQTCASSDNLLLQNMLVWCKDWTGCENVYRWLHTKKKNIHGKVTSCCWTIKTILWSFHLGVSSDHHVSHSQSHPPPQRTACNCWAPMLTPCQLCGVTWVLPSIFLLLPIQSRVRVWHIPPIPGITWHEAGIYLIEFYSLYKQTER